MLSVNGRSSKYRGTRGDRGSVRLTQGGLRAKSCDDICPRVVCEQSPAMMFTQGISRAKFCDDVCPKVVCKQSPAMMFAQGWIMSKVLR